MQKKHHRTRRKHKRPHNNAGKYHRLRKVQRWKKKKQRQAD